MKPTTLLRLYPRAWRERYGDEFLELVGQTGLGPRVLFDVVTAASREWVRTLAGGGVAAALAEQGRQALVLYGVMALSFAITQWFGFGDFARVDFASARTHVDMLALFVIALVTARITHALAWRFVLRGWATRREAQYIGFGAVVVAAILTGVIGYRFELMYLWAHPGFVVTLMLGEQLSRPAGIRRALEDGRRRAPGRIGMAN